MSTNSTAKHRSAAKISSQSVAIPIDAILGKLALQSSKGQQHGPNSWSSLHIRSPVQIETEGLQSLNPQYQLQHNAHAVFDHNSKKWRIEGEGNQTALKNLGVIASKKHGARAIQLPNHTHKIVAGIISADSLFNAFSAPIVSSDGKKLTLNPISKAEFPFTAVSPQLYAGKSSGSKIANKTQYKHLEYVLHSSKKEGESVNKTELSWSESPHKTINLVNGTDIEDLSQYKNILTALRSDLLLDQHTIQIDNYKKQTLQKRLLLLQHQIDGLLKRKINYTSKDIEGNRFLDFTTLLNQKENQIITLHKKIQNLDRRLSEKKEQENKLRTEVQRLNEVIKTLNNPNATRQDIDNLLLSQFETINIHKQSQKLKNKANATHHIFKSHLKDLQLKGVKVDNEAQLNALVDQSQNISAHIDQGIVHIVETKDKIIEVPLQDAKTKQLIKQMGIELYRIYGRYPKVKEEADPHFIELLNKEVLNVVDADGLSKITQIIRYVPSLVKVENIYSFNNDRQRKIQFHLRVLLKALITQFEKIKAKTGVTPEIDESVVTMIHEQIGDASIDDILKVFQVNQKIVEVPKIVQKIVERVIEVPTIVPMEKIVEKIVYDTKIEQIQKIVHVPIEVIKYVDRIVQKIVQVEKIKQKIIEVPKIVQKIVQKRIQVPKIIEVQVIKEKIVEVEKPVIIQKIVNHAVPQIKQVEVIKQQTVVVKEVEERIKQVERIVEKIVERIVEKPVIIEVQKIVEKLVNTVHYKPARQVVNHIEQIPQIIQRVVEKVIPIIQIVEKIKQVPKIIQKIVEVRVEVPTVKQIKVIQEKIVYQDRVKQVQKIVQKIVPLVREVIKEVQKRVEIPIIQQKLVKVVEYIEKITPERIETVKIVQVQKIVQKLVQVPKMIEVQKSVFKYITVEKPVKVVVETIVQVPKIVERIKEVRVPVDKIIEKLVEVPKVVEVEKIVEKIVVVPRVVQKIVQVPQIVEKIIDRIVEIQKIRQVVRQVKVPVIQQRIVEIEIIKNVQVPIYKTIQIIRQKIVPAIQQKQVIKPVEVVRQKIVQSRIQIAKELITQKIVPHTVQIQKIVQVQKAIVIPFQLPVPCDKVIQKLVLVQKQVQKIVQIPVQVQKIVQTIKQIATVKQITKIQTKPVIQERIKEVQKIVPYITQKVTQVQVIRQKPVLAPQVQQRIKQVAAIQEKIVQVVHEVPKIYEVEKIVEKTVEVPRFIEITAKQPVIINNSKIVQKFIDKIVQVILKQQQIVEVPTIQQKIVPVQTIIQQIKQIYLNKDKIVQLQKLISKTNVENKIETKYQTVDRIQQKLVPVSNSFEKIVQVPQLMEKVVQRIHLMPQVHQVTQHIIDVHEEGNPGVAVDVQFTQHQQKYNKLYRNLKKDTGDLLVELKAMKKGHPELASKLTQIETYITQLDQISAFPKIVQVTKQKVVNKDVAVPVLMSRRSAQNVKTQAFYLVLIQKLIKQIKNARKNSNYSVSDEQIKLLFLNEVSKEEDKKLKDKIQQFKHSKQGSKYSVSGQSLLSQVLYDKFYLASLLEKSKLQTERYRRISDQRLELLHRYKQTNDILHQKLLALQETLRNIFKKDSATIDKATLEKLKKVELQIEQLDQLLFSDIKTIKVSEPILSISKVPGGDINYRLQESRIRQLESQVELLRRDYIDKAGSIIGSQQNTDKDRVIDSLRQKIINLADNKGTKTTLGDDERRDTITSLDKIGDKTVKKSLKNETSILGFLSPAKSQQADWDEFPIIKEEDAENNENFGYIVLPHGKLQKNGKSYKVIENKQNDSYIILPLDHTEAAHKHQTERLKVEQQRLRRERGEQIHNYPYGNNWLPLVQTDHGASGNSHPQVNQSNLNRASGHGTNTEDGFILKGSHLQKHIVQTITKNGEESSKGKSVVSKKSGAQGFNPRTSQQKPGQWIDPKASQLRPATTEWVDPKSISKGGAGQWVSPKSVPIQGTNDYGRTSTLNVDPSRIIVPASNQPNYIVTQPQFTIIQPNVTHTELVPSGQSITYSYQQPGTLIIPNFFNPNNIPNLPGNVSRITYIDENGNPVQAYNQAGQLEGDAGNGATYNATYLYKSEVKEEGTGQHKIEKKITEIRTNQTVNWISRSRVVQSDSHSVSPQKESHSPSKDFIVTPKK